MNVTRVPIIFKIPELLHSCFVMNDQEAFPCNDDQDIDIDIDVDIDAIMDDLQKDIMSDFQNKVIKGLVESFTDQMKEVTQGHLLGNAIHQTSNEVENMEKEAARCQERIYRLQMKLYMIVQEEGHKDCSVVDDELRAPAQDGDSFHVKVYKNWLFDERNRLELLRMRIERKKQELQSFEEKRSRTLFINDRHEEDHMPSPVRS
jgi:hypothetical protein